MHLWCCEGPKLTTRGGEWEPIQISSKFETSAYVPKITASPRTYVSENSYGQAISKQKTQVAARKQRRDKLL